MKKDISTIIKEWKNEAGVKSIIMVSAFADFKYFCGSTNGRAGFYYIFT